MQNNQKLYENETLYSKVTKYETMFHIKLQNSSGQYFDVWGKALLTHAQKCQIISNKEEKSYKCIPF